MKLKKTFENLLITNKNINEHFKISRETFELNIDSSQGPARQLITAQKCPLIDAVAINTNYSTQNVEQWVT